VQLSQYEGFVDRMRRMSIPALARLYRPEQRVYAHCVRRRAGADGIEGVSRRYTAITLIGLASEPREAARAALCGHDSRDVCAAMLAETGAVENLGDVALTLWACAALEHDDCSQAVARLIELWGRPGPKMTVEVAWVLTAAALLDHRRDLARVRDEARKRLLDAFSATSRVFPHVVGGSAGALRSHVACFADQVYPIYALAKVHAAARDSDALRAAEACAAMICERMGDAGQWWWHYDYRTGRVIEGYPVYAVHQDAMGPMALLALRDAGGRDFSQHVARGLNWLARSPELDGRSLVDEESGWIWRKVARREPRKLVRRMQAGLSNLHAGLRVPAADLLFPPRSIDWESRPYHYGWLLHAFKPTAATIAPPTPVGVLT
jgi:hypothetical protein